MNQSQRVLVVFCKGVLAFLSLKKDRLLSPQPTTRTVIYRSKMHRVLKRNFEVFPVLDWIAAVTAHIPNKGEHLVRYYGWFSNVNRAKRKKAEEQAQHAAPTGSVEIPSPPGSSIFKQRWAELIKKVYEADPDPVPPWEWRRRRKRDW